MGQTRASMALHKKIVRKQSDFCTIKGENGKNQVKLV